MSILRQITQDKQASSVLSQEIVLPYALVENRETPLLKIRLSLPVAFLINNRIVTFGCV